MNSAYLALLDRLDDLSQRIEAFPAISATPPQSLEWESTSARGVSPDDSFEYETLLSIERRLAAGALLSLELQRRIDGLTSALDEQRMQRSAEGRELRAFIDSRLFSLERRLDIFMRSPALPPAAASTPVCQLVDHLGDSGQQRTDRQSRETFGQNVVPLKQPRQRSAPVHPDLDRTIAELIGSLTAING